MADVFDQVNGVPLEKLVAGIAGDSAEMDAIAAMVESTMKAEAAKSIDTGRFEESITTVKAGRGKDRIVGSTDPLAVPKEFGHIIRDEKGGPELGYVPGMHILGKTLARLPKVD